MSDAKIGEIIGNGGGGVKVESGVQLDSVDGGTAGDGSHRA